MSAKQRVEKGIYYNEKCTKSKFFVQMMVRGRQFYKACSTLVEAQQYKEKVISSTERVETDIHPLILRESGALVLEVNFQKYYEDTEEGRARALKIATILDNLMDED